MSSFSVCGKVFDGVWGDIVIGIHKEQVGACTIIYAGVACSRYAFVGGVMDNADGRFAMRVAIDDGIEYGDGVVARGIVDEDVLNVVVGLFEEADGTALDVLFDAVDGD